MALWLIGMLVYFCVDKATWFIAPYFSAINATARVYVSKVTTVEERTTHVAYLSLFQTLGFILGPAIQVYTYI